MPSDRNFMSFFGSKSPFVADSELCHRDLPWGWRFANDEVPKALPAIGFSNGVTCWIRGAPNEPV